MQNQIRSKFVTVQAFVREGSNVVSLLIVVAVIVAIVALVPMRDVLNALSPSAAKVDTTEIASARMRQEELKDHWLERSDTTTTARATRQGDDVLSEEWLMQRNVEMAAKAAARQHQEELKDHWLERHGSTATEVSAEKPYAQEEPYPSGFEQWPHSQ